MLKMARQQVRRDEIEIIMWSFLTFETVCRSISVNNGEPSEPDNRLHRINSSKELLYECELCLSHIKFSMVCCVFAEDFNAHIISIFIVSLSHFIV